MATYLFAVTLAKVMLSEMHEYKSEMQLWLHVCIPQMQQKVLFFKADCIQNVVSKEKL